ncbi:unnamed protein product [Cochlearia groenlandica]
MASEDIEFKCYVGNMDIETERYELEDAFSKFGEIKDTIIFNSNSNEDDDYDGPSPRAYGFVTFKDKKSMRDAIKGMQGQKIGNTYKTITVEESYSSLKSRGRGPGRGRKKKA